MRERVGYGEVGRRAGRAWPHGTARESARRIAGEIAGQITGDAGPGAGGWYAECRRRVARPGRRRSAGPRPVRPGVAPVAVRPPEPPRPVGPGGRPVVDAVRIGQGPRLLGPRSGEPTRRRYRLRRAVAGLAVVVASAAAVVALGLLAQVSAPATATADRAASAPRVPADGTVDTAGTAVTVGTAGTVVTAAPGETVWEVVDRVAPGLSGERRAALAERIVADNALTSVRPRPGQVLRVAAG